MRLQAFRALRRRLIGVLGGGLAGLAACVGSVVGQSTIDPEASMTWGGNIGWLNWYADEDHGVRVGTHTCAGFIYSGNVGWIHLGDGQPANGVHYANDSLEDYGVNIEAGGELRGWAYGANIGWIRFEDLGDPRLLRGSGRLVGHAYSLNVGWLSLGSEESPLQTLRMAVGNDSDGDGIPDDWERARAGDLETLGEGSDWDDDGVTDYQEYVADTDPTNPESSLQIIEISRNRDEGSVTLRWSGRVTRQYWVEMREALEDGSPWTRSEAGILPGETESQSVTLPVPADSRQHYFRLGVRLPVYDGTFLVPGS